MEKQQYQGDVSILSSQAIEAAAEKLQFNPLPEKGLVVAEGEVTGHKHTIVAEPEAIVEIAKDTRGYFLRVKKGQATIQHQEHAAQVIPQGIWFVGQQWEYSEINEKRVSD